MGLNYYVVDVETNGLKCFWAEVIEISIIRCADKHQLTRQIKAEFPERSNPESLAITGRTIVDIMQGDSKEDVVAACNKFFEQDGGIPEHRCMIGHNASFDKRFCHALWETAGQKFPANYWLDTKGLAKQWAKKTGIVPENYKLSTIVKTAGINSVPGIHAAECDSQNTFLLWKKIMGDGVDHLPLVKQSLHKFQNE